MEYNLPEEKNKFKWYEGRNVEQMSKLRAEGKVPMNTYQLMQTKLEVRNGPEAVKISWMDNDFDTGDGVVYHPNGDVKIVLDSQHLREMIPEVRRNGGALVLGEDAYKKLQGEVFKKGNLEKIKNRMSRADVKAHPVLRVLARDQALLNDYTDFIFEEYQLRFAKGSALDDLRLIGVFPGSCVGCRPEMIAWHIKRLRGGSDAYGWGDLNYRLGRIVGITPETLGNQNRRVRYN